MKPFCEVVIDEEGAIKLPDYFLAKSGLRPGIRLTVQLDTLGEIHLFAQPPSNNISLGEENDLIEVVEEAGHVFLRGVQPFDLNKLIEEEREARMNEFLQGISL